MKIDNNMIAKKDVVGQRADGSPVVMIVTHGGLFAFFSKTKKGEVETLGMAPHKAIAAWMTEKKARDIKWKDDFAKSEQTEIEDLKKSNKSSYVRLRKLLFSNQLLKNQEKSDYYIIYDTKEIVIGVMHKTEIQSALDSGSLYKESFVRNVNLNEPVQFISQHKEFRID